MYLWVKTSYALKTTFHMSTNNRPNLTAYKLYQNERLSLCKFRMLNGPTKIQTNNLNKGL